MGEFFLNEATVDVWSVGCILGELISNKPLYPGKHCNTSATFATAFFGFSVVYQHIPFVLVLINKIVCLSVAVRLCLSSTT